MFKAKYLEKSLINDSSVILDGNGGNFCVNISIIYKNKNSFYSNTKLTKKQVVSGLKLVLFSCSVLVYYLHCYKNGCVHFSREFKTDVSKLFTCELIRFIVTK